MKHEVKISIARRVGTHLQALGILSPTFKEFDRAWYELHKTQNVDYPDISLRVAKGVYDLMRVYA